MTHMERTDSKGKGVIVSIPQDGMNGAGSVNVALSKASSSKDPINTISTHESSWMWKPKHPGPKAHESNYGAIVDPGLNHFGPLTKKIQEKPTVEYQ